MKKRYFVRLAFTMLNDTESDAVQDVVDLFAEHGTRSWVYVVDDADSGERIGYFNGWGEPVDTDLVDAAAATLRNDPAPENSALEDAPLEPSTLDDDTNDDVDDDDLERFADSLNQE